MKNDVVEVVAQNESTFIIKAKEKEVGWIQIDRDKSEVSFFVEEKYRGNHYCSNGLYLLDKMVADSYPLLKAVIPLDNPLAKHVVEHSGYYIIRSDEQNIYYQHENFHTTLDDAQQLKENEEALYFAGGCFWGMERVFKILDGVLLTKTGYANGTLANPTYADIIRNQTGYKETVKVVYDQQILSLEKLLEAYFMCIHPDQKDGQGEDIGEQYTTGVYYKNPALKQALEAIFAKKRAEYQEFYVELKPLECFYEAEEYHQDYLDKNPNGYCHITLVDLEKVRALNKKA